MDIFGELLYLLTSRKNQIVVLSKFKIGMLTREIVNVAGKGLSAGDIAQAMAGPAMAIAIGYALKAPAMVLFTLAPVGYAANAMGGAGGPFAVYLVAIFASEMGKAVSKDLERDAADGQHPEEPAGVDSSHSHEYDYRPGCDLHFRSGNEWCGSQFGHGYLRTLRTDRCVDRVD